MTDWGDVEPFKRRKPVEMDETYVGGRRKARYTGEVREGRPGARTIKRRRMYLAWCSAKGIAAMATRTVRSSELLPIVQERVLRCFGIGISCPFGVV